MANLGSPIPLARRLSDGVLIPAQEAQRKPGRDVYCCLDPRCGKSLTVGLSKRGRQFFKHFKGDTPDACRMNAARHSNGQHSMAQTLLANLFDDAIHHRFPMPILRFETPWGVREAIPLIQAEYVETEWTCQQTGRRADVALLDQHHAPVFLIEVFHTHAVDGNKRLDLSNYWWIEVNAQEVIEDPSVLNIRNHGGFPYDYEIYGRQGNLFEGKLGGPK